VRLGQGSGMRGFLSVKNRLRVTRSPLRLVMIPAGTHSVRIVLRFRRRVT
jgi:hypothetical protein